MSDDKSESGQFSCPVEGSDDRITIAHGGGGRLTRALIEKKILPRFASSFENGQDSVILPLGDQQLAFTTDSYVVSPLFFPGGDIGSLAVSGTVNDLAMSGARPLYLSVALVIEEGFPVATLEAVLQSMADTAQAANVELVTGDTKVVERGHGDGLYINTSGIGLSEGDLPGPQQIREGDVVITSGDIGRHGIAIMAQRENLKLECAIESDMACLHQLVAKLQHAGIDLHCLRDLTRGGLGTALLELAGDAGLTIQLQEPSVPVSVEVANVCQLLGIDPLYVANEGRMVLFVPEGEAEKILELLKADPLGAQAAVIGTVTAEQPGKVILETAYGTRRYLSPFSGEQLPRIC